MSVHSFASLVHVHPAAGAMSELERRRASRTPTHLRGRMSPPRERQLLALLDSCDHSLARTAGPPSVIHPRLPQRPPRYTSHLPLHKGYYPQHSFKPKFIQAMVYAVGFYDGLHHESRSTFVVPPMWKEASESIRAQFYDLALHDEGEVATFTARLSHDRMDGAIRAKKSFVRSMQDNLSKAMSRQLGTSLPCWFALEASPSDDPHLHGSISIDGIDVKEVRHMLRQAAGPSTVPGFSSHQLDMAAPYTLMGWSAYSTKELTTTSMILDCRPISATSDLREKAESLYNDVRDIIRSARSAGRSPARRTH